jgi:hypothetical protein
LLLLGLLEDPELLLHGRGLMALLLWGKLLLLSPELLLSP